MEYLIIEIEFRVLCKYTLKILHTSFEKDNNWIVVVRKFVSV